jgi:hypothetical protein
MKKQRRGSRTRRSLGIAAGQTVGSWQLVKRIGQGGNGQVWRGRAVDGDVAIKFLEREGTVARQRCSSTQGERRFFIHIILSA